jgi:hypothetical protein
VHIEGDVGVGHDAFGNLRRLLGVEAAISEDRCQLTGLGLRGVSASERRSISSSRSMSSFCARTLTHSPAAIEIAPANRPDTPARRASKPSVEAPAMPESGDIGDQPIDHPEDRRPGIPTLDIAVVDDLEAVMLIRGAVHISILQ